MIDRSGFTLALQAIGAGLNKNGADVKVYVDCDPNALPGILKMYAETARELGSKIPIVDNCDPNSVSDYIEKLLNAVYELNGGSRDLGKD